MRSAFCGSGKLPPDLYADETRMNTQLSRSSMDSLAGIANYSDSDSCNEDESLTVPERVQLLVKTKSRDVITAPQVIAKEEVFQSKFMVDTSKHVDLTYNPTYEELFAPEQGPKNPFKTEQALAKANTLTGYVEPTHINDFQFENQRRTFHSFGYAEDPSIDSMRSYVTNCQMGEIGKTVFEKMKKRPGDKRAREMASDPSNIDGYLGPWGKYVDEETVSKPSGEDQEYLKLYLEKRAKRKRNTIDDPSSAETGDEKSTLHIEDPYDYQGRSFLTASKELSENDLLSDEAPAKCFIPKTCVHTWNGHTKGLSVIKWFPKTAHLLMSSGLDGKVKLWEVYGKRRCVRTYLGHKQAVKDFDFNNDGSRFLTVSFDRMIKLWDTETGKCISRYTNKKNPYCVKFNPDDDKQNLFLVGCSDKKIHCFNIDSAEIVQEYDRHLGNVNTITFIDENRRFVSTSDDKSMRVWEWDIPVDWKYIADPSMHSMPRVALSFTGKWLAGQSMDNQIKVFNAPAKLRENRKKVFKGHMVAGYACGLGFSPDGSYVISGDADGKLVIWDWKTTKLYERIKAHDKVCIDVLWHPHEPSKVATAGWDGLVKLWD